MIYFVRHGETYDNANGNLLSGWSEVSLNDRGISQARKRAEELKTVKFDICYCSPLLRAKQTLEEILKFHDGLQVIYDDRLKERDYGEITSKPASIFKFRRWNANDIIRFKMESIPQMFDRVANFYNEILPKQKGKNILIVSHSGTARLTHFYFAGKPSDNDYSDFSLGNAKLMMIDEKSKSKWVIFVNETKYKYI